MERIRSLVRRVQAWFCPRPPLDLRFPDPGPEAETGRYLPGFAWRQQERESRRCRKLVGFGLALAVILFLIPFDSQPGRPNAGAGVFVAGSAGGTNDGATVASAGVMATCRRAIASLTAALGRLTRCQAPAGTDQTLVDAPPPDAGPGGR